MLFLRDDGCNESLRRGFSISGGSTGMAGLTGKDRALCSKCRPKSANNEPKSTNNEPKSTNNEPQSADNEPQSADNRPQSTKFTTLSADFCRGNRNGVKLVGGQGVP
jgi:hypothetical protein